MSALVGMVRFDSGPVERRELQAMLDAQAAHGPDLSGSWCRGRVGLGMRLMRFTAEDDFEQQPLESADGQRVLVFDGRLDNRPELAGMLDVSVAEMRGLPDSALVLRAYEKWGVDCAAQLIGDCAWAMWDAREQRLLLARSPFGSRSVFVHASSARLAFASRPKGLFALDSVPRAIDTTHLLDSLLVRFPDPGSTYFKDVGRLQAGYVLEVRPSGWTTRPYWAADPRRELRLAADQDYVDAFTALFDRVVADYSRSRTPVGVMMSGGLDSTSIATTAAGQARKRGESITAFTEVPRAGFIGPIGRGRYADETSLVRAVAERYANLESVLVRTDGRTFLDGLDAFLDAAEAPFPAAANRTWYDEILRQSHERGLRVLLTGGGGNLTMSWEGQPRLPQLLAAGQWRRAWREARAQRHASESALRVLVGQGIVPLLPHQVWRALQWLRAPDGPAFTRATWQAYAPLHPNFARRVGAEQRMSVNGRDPHRRPSLNTRRTRLRILAGTRETHADIVAGCEALFGVQIREPALDVRLVEFCLAVPEEQCLHGSDSRWLIRRAMRDRLPSAVLDNTRRGLQAADWLERLQGADQQIARELGQLSASDLASKIIDVARLRQLAAGLATADGTPERLRAAYGVVLGSGLMNGALLRSFERAGRTDAPAATTSIGAQ